MTDDLIIAEPEAAPEELGKLIELEEALVAQNTAMINQLAIIGQGVHPTLLDRIQMETIVDFMFDDELARKQFDTACHMKMNANLKTALAQYAQGLVIPPDAEV